MLRLALGVCASALVATGALAQQAPPPGVRPVPLQQVYHFDTAEQHGIKVEVVARGMARSFALAFLPDGDLLVAERGGNLRLVRGATGRGPALVAEPIAGMPLPSATNRAFGLNDVSVDPAYASNGLVYWTWNTVEPGADATQPPEQGRFTIMRGRLSGLALTEVTTLYAAEQPGYPGGARVEADGRGHLWASTGAPFGAEGQDPASPYGKVLRLNADGTIPADNPFADRADVHPAVYSLGHRDQHGLTVLADGTVLTAEHGPNGGDELNIITAGANYGWPLVSLGRNYDGSGIDTAARHRDGMVDPLVAWLPSIAPSGLMVYTGDAFPAWRGNVFVGSGRQGGINNTGGLERVVFNAQWGELRRESLLGALHQRVRDVAQGPDGLIYVLIDGPDTAVLRLSPATPSP